MGFNLSVKAKFLFTLLYGFAILFYTFYGLSKSFTEYFCLQARPDIPDSTNVWRDMQSLNFSGFGYGNSWAIVNFDEVFYVYNNSKEVEIVKHDDGVTDLNRTVYRGFTEITKGALIINYARNKSFFKITCNPDRTAENPVPNEFSSNVLNSYRWAEDYYVNEHGYLEFRRNKDFSYFVVDKKVVIYRITCILEKAKETCEMLESTKNYFTIIFLSSSSLLICFTVLTFFPIRQEWPKRAMSKLFEIMGSSGMEHLDFCNPLTRKPVSIKKGDEYFCLDSSPQGLNTEAVHVGELEGPIFNKLSDSHGKYKIKKHFLVITLNDGSREVIRVNQRAEIKIKMYFKMVWESHRNCIMNEIATHYMKTKDVLTSLIEGNTIISRKSTKDTWGLISEIHLNELMKSFVLKKNILKTLMRHNEIFFGSFNYDALELALSRKISYNYKPEKIKNSQWKWYGSDFSKLMVEFKGGKWFSQVNWRPSDAMKQAVHEAESNSIIIDKPPGDYTFEKEKGICFDGLIGLSSIGDGNFVSKELSTIEYGGRKFLEDINISAEKAFSKPHSCKGIGIEEVKKCVISKKRAFKSLDDQIKSLTISYKDKLLQDLKENYSKNLKELEREERKRDRKRGKIESSKNTEEIKTSTEKGGAETSTRKGTEIDEKELWISIKPDLSLKLSRIIKRVRDSVVTNFESMNKYSMLYYACLEGVQEYDKHNTVREKKTITIDVSEEIKEVLYKKVRNSNSKKRRKNKSNKKSLKNTREKVLRNCMKTPTINEAIKLSLESLEGLKQSKLTPEDLVEINKKCDERKLKKKTVLLILRKFHKISQKDKIVIKVDHREINLESYREKDEKGEKFIYEPECVEYLEDLLRLFPNEKIK